MPADSRTVLYYLTKQLYDDIRFVTHLNPVNVVDSETSDAFNALLAEAKQVFAGNGILREMRDMSPRNLKYKDAVCVAGQLHSICALLSGAATAHEGHHAPPAADAKPEGAKGNDTLYEEELYGASAKTRRNPDGTIPFSLE
ncbi:MAG: hypothetical protein SF028_12100 [Candidatus Sumerlaeia bacterium]|nr:hypothetical protein [Candidatus Sumerlaeia bacterium]